MLGGDPAPLCLMHGNLERGGAKAHPIAESVAELHDGVVKWTGPAAQPDDSSAHPVVQFSQGRATDPIEAVR